MRTPSTNVVRYTSVNNSNRELNRTNEALINYSDNN
jgi:hypothetical protein